MVSGLADGAAACAPPDGARLRRVTADLAGVLLAHFLGAPGPVAADARQRTLMIRVQAFIDQRLTDRQLSPGQIAAAPTTSGPGTLHRLFADHGLTVAGWIRQRRLDRCRRDLADPRLAAQYIDTIARPGHSPTGRTFPKPSRAPTECPPHAGAHRQETPGTDRQPHQFLPWHRRIRKT